VAALSGFGSVYLLIAGSVVQAAPVNGRVYAYKIGGTTPQPEIARQRSPIPAPPAVEASADQVGRGAALYSELCSACHGAGAAGGVVADLRRSGRLQQQAAWRGAVIQGALVSIGMPDFGQHLTPEDADAIRAYVARQAALAYAAQRKTPPQ
jgi:mono/diheme cytochrome c family protein